MDSSDVVLVLTTLPAEADADAFGQALVNDRLAACVSASGEMRSTYRWQGAVTTETERQLLIKTTARCVPDLRNRFTALHPYSTPEFLVLAVADGGADYLAWVRQSTEGALSS